MLYTSINKMYLETPWSVLGAPWDTLEGHGRVDREVPTQAQLRRTRPPRLVYTWGTDTMSELFLDTS